ncbi:TPA: hypothetical protein ACSP3S_003321 [Aeromonas veronii]
MDNKLRPTGVLDIVIRGRWKSPNHSTNKKLDDTHEVKGVILKSVGRKVYEKLVGKNPDLDVSDDGKIILRDRSGTGRVKYYETDLDAVNFFDDLYLEIIIDKCNGSKHCIILTYEYEFHTMPHINNIKKYLYENYGDDDFQSHYILPPSIEALVDSVIYKIENYKENSCVIIIETI